MKLKLHIAALLIISILASTVLAQGTIYTVPTYGKAMVEQGSFTDIGNSSYATDILKLRALNIIQGNSGRYDPAQNVTYQEAAAYLIRLLGLENEAMQKAARVSAQGITPRYNADSWAIGFMEEAIAQGILTEAEVNQMNTLTQAQRQAIENQVNQEAKQRWIPLARRQALIEERQQAAIEQNKNMRRAISRQDLALWIFRALKMEPVLSNDIYHIYNFADYTQIKADRQNPVETLIQNGILQGASTNRYGAEAGVTRGELAKALMAVVKKFPELTGVETGIARIVSMERNYHIDPLRGGNNQILNMEDFDGQEFQINIQDTQFLPVIAGSKVYNQDFLRQGDTVEYAKRNGQIIYLSMEDYGFVQGTLSYYDEGIIRILDKQNNIIELVMNRDTIITALGKPANASSLIVGQNVKALYKDKSLNRLDIQENVDYYKGTQYVDGIIKFIDKENRVIKFEDYDGNIRTYSIDPRVIVTINEYYENIYNLQPQQDATFEIAGGLVKAIKAFTMPGEPVSREYLAMLRVRGVEGNTIKVTPLDDRQDLRTFKTENYTSITYLGYPIKLYNIKTGDLVKIRTNENNLDTAERIELVTKRHRVEKVYKARILNTLPTQNRLALSNVQTYRYPGWEKLDDEKIFPVKRDAEIYKDGRKLTLADLDKQKNVEAYIVTVNDFGEETIAKITLKSVSEDSVFSGTFSTKWTENSITLNDGQKLIFDEGTIIIKDRRLLDTTDLTYNDEAFIIKNKLPGGSNYAAIISMENGNGFDYRNVVRGYIHDMGEDNFSLESYANLINNEWDYHYDGENYFYLSKDTKILDNVVKRDYITRDTFLESRFWEKDKDGKPKSTVNKDKYTIHDPALYNDDKGPHYQKCKNKSLHMLAYAVINEDGEATAINIYKRDPNLGKEEVDLKENLITGEVVRFNETFTQLFLTDVKEYSKFYNQWRPISSTTAINTQKALIIKNEQVITLNHLTPGDKIYAITDQNNGILIFVE